MRLLRIAHGGFVGTCIQWEASLIIAMCPRDGGPRHGQPTCLAKPRLNSIAPRLQRVRMEMQDAPLQEGGGSLITANTIHSTEYYTTRYNVVDYYPLPRSVSSFTESHTHRLDSLRRAIPKGAAVQVRVRMLARMCATAYSGLCRYWSSRCREQQD